VRRAEVELAVAAHCDVCGHAGKEAFKFAVSTAVTVSVPTVPLYYSEVSTRACETRRARPTEEASAEGPMHAILSVHALCKRTCEIDGSPGVVAAG
jgi:hypothetical protein